MYQSIKYRIRINGSKKLKVLDFYHKEIP